MNDASRPVAPQYDPLRHTLTIAEVEAQLMAAGVPRTRRHVQRLCSNGSFDAARLGASDEWYIAPDSVPKVVGDLRALDEQRARRAAAQHDASRHVAQEIRPKTDTDVSRHDAPQHDASPAQNTEKGSATSSDTSRPVATDYDIYEHPYVKRLESQVEKWEGKYQEQVRRTEEIQIQSQDKILELQRMTTIGQSKTLADFMLDAKEWIIGNPRPIQSKSPDTSSTT